MKKTAESAPYKESVGKKLEQIERKSVMNTEIELPPIRWEKVGLFPIEKAPTPKKVDKNKYEPRHRARKSSKRLYLFSLAMLALALALGSALLW